MPIIATLLMWFLISPRRPSVASHQPLSPWFGDVGKIVEKNGCPRPRHSCIRTITSASCAHHLTRYLADYLGPVSLQKKRTQRRADQRAHQDPDGPCTRRVLGPSTTSSHRSCRPHVRKTAPSSSRRQQRRLPRLTWSVAARCSIPAARLATTAGSHHREPGRFHAGASPRPVLARFRTFRDCGRRVWRADRVLPARPQSSSRCEVTGDYRSPDNCVERSSSWL